MLFAKHVGGEWFWIYLGNIESSQFTLGKRIKNGHVDYVSSGNQNIFCQER